MTRGLGATITMLAAAAAMSAGLAQGGQAAKPQLRFAGLSPFVVVGTGFRPGEMVRVAVRADGSAASARDRAGRAGTIRVSFTRLRLAKCPTYVVAATGDKGSRAVLRSIPRPCGIDP
jgi:hypothetical protein